jgi:glycosyltransferase involved in cell wall biosynthesis
VRILLAHKYFKMTGGAELFFFETGRVLEEHGHQVAYFSTSDNDNLETCWSKYFIDAPEYNSDSFVKRIASLRKIIYSRAAEKAFTELLHEFRPDIIHAFGIYTHLTPSIFVAAKKFEIPVVMSCNDYKHICPNYKLYDGSHICEACKNEKFYNAIVKKCCKNSLVYSVASSIESYAHQYMNVYEKYVDKYLFASQFMLDKTKEFWRNKNVSYGILKNPFNVEEYSPVYEGDYALYFGRIIEEKGVDRLISAASRVNIPIKIVGDGPDYHKLRTIVEKEQIINIDMLGPVWGEDLNAILYGARFVVVPSLWHENFPYVIFQAFAAGKPVLGSNRGGIPELIGRERGMLFEPDKENDLEERMQMMWEDSTKCTLQGMVARKYVINEFNDEKFYESLIRNYLTVLQ